MSKPDYRLALLKDGALISVMDLTKEEAAGFTVVAELTARYLRDKHSLAGKLAREVKGSFGLSEPRRERPAELPRFVVEGTYTEGDDDDFSKLVDR